RPIWASHRLTLLVVSVRVRVVSVRVRRVPLPGGGDDRLDAWVLDLPVEVGLRLRRIGVEGGWVAGAAWAELVRDTHAGNALDGLDHLQHRGRGAGAKVVEE